MIQGGAAQQEEGIRQIHPATDKQFEGESLKKTSDN